MTRPWSLRTSASHRIDGVVPILTLITIITAPLTLLATIFGIDDVAGLFA